MSSATLSIVLALAAAAPGAARAADSDLDSQPAWGFELRTGPYQPRVGSGNVRTYYEQFYATGGGLFKNRPLMTELEVDWYVLRGDFGLLGPMIHAGFWSVSGKTRGCPSAADPNALGPCTWDQITGFESQPSKTDTTTLAVYPLGLGFVYRFDLLKRNTPVPVVPYAKASLEYYIWRNTTDGSVSWNGAHKAQGGTLGVRGTAGLALNLDFIERDTAARARTTVGVTDTYLFFEASQIWVNGFGDTRRLDLSSTLFQAGVAIDFQ